jgi:hypothetical protein
MEGEGKEKGEGGREKDIHTKVGKSAAAINHSICGHKIVCISEQRIVI